MMLVTLQEAKDHLRIDTDDGDSDLTLKIHGASGAVMNYIKAGLLYIQEVDGEGEPVTDSDGNPVYTTEVRFEVKAAVLLMLGYLDKDRDNDAKHEYEAGYLPRPITALLFPLRDPALA